MNDDKPSREEQVAKLREIQKEELAKRDNEFKEKQFDTSKFEEEIPESVAEEAPQEELEPKGEEKILDKFKNVDELAKAYKELEKKLGSQEDTIEEPA